jgi:hypothetical protein
MEVRFFPMPRKYRKGPSLVAMADLRSGFQRSVPTVEPVDEVTDTEEPQIDRKALQARAKEAGIAANQSNAALLEALGDE